MLIADQLTLAVMEKGMDRSKPVYVQLPDGQMVPLTEEMFEEHTNEIVIKMEAE